MKRLLVLALLLAGCDRGPDSDPFEGEYVGIRGSQVQLRTVGTVTISLVSQGRYELTAIPGLPCSPLALERVSESTLVPVVGQTCAAIGTVTVAGTSLSVALDTIAFKGARR